MSKQNDIEDLLGDAPAKGKKAPAAKKAAPVVEAKAPAAKKAVAKAEPEAKVKAPAAKKAAKVEDDILGEAPAKAAPSKKAPISFAEGERQALADAVTAHFKRSKKGINSKDLATKLETETRKLRVVLYALVTKGVVSLEAGASKVAGMTVSPA